MKKVIIRITLILLVCIFVILVLQMGNYNKLLTGKIEYESHFWDSHLVPTKIGHYQIDDKKYNIKFFHSDPFASLNCPYAVINDEVMTFCNFYAMELVNNKYFVVYYTFRDMNSVFLYDLNLDIIGRINYLENYSGEQIIELYERGEFVNIEDTNTISTF